MPLILESFGMGKEISLVGAPLQLSPPQKGPQDGDKDATKKPESITKMGQLCRSRPNANAQYPWKGKKEEFFYCFQQTRKLARAIYSCDIGIMA